MAVTAKDLGSDVSVLSLMLARVEDIAINTAAMKLHLETAIDSIRKEVHDVDLQVARVVTKVDSVIKTLGDGDDSIPSAIVNLQTRVQILEEQIRVAQDQGNRVKMAWVNSFLFPIFVGVVLSFAGWMMLKGGH